MRGGKITRRGRDKDRGVGVQYYTRERISQKTRNGMMEKIPWAGRWGRSGLARALRVPAYTRAMLDMPSSAL